MFFLSYQILLMKLFSRKADAFPMIVDVLRCSDKPACSLSNAMFNRSLSIKDKEL